MASAAQKVLHSPRGDETETVFQYLAVIDVRSAELMGISGNGKKKLNCVFGHDSVL